MLRRVWVGLGLVAALAMGGASPAGAVVGFDVSGTTYLTGQNAQTRSHSAQLMFIDDSYGGKIGGVIGSPPFAAGAEIYGYATPKLGIETNVISSQLSKFGATVSATTEVRGADMMGGSKVGDSFTLSTTLNQGAENYMNIDSAFSADLRLVHGLKLEAGGQGCVFGCISAGIKVNLGEGETYLAGISQAGQLNVFGQNVGGLSYTDPTGVLNVTANVPNFDGQMKNTAGGPKVVSRQGLIDVSLDAAQAFATAVGLPFPLKGEIGGFDYTILSATIGGGFDIVKTVAFEAVTKGVNYVFSAPVQVFDKTKNAWSELTSSWFTQGDGSDLEVRSPNALSLGVTRYDVLGGNLTTSLDLVGYVSGRVQALGINGYGIGLGPLLDEGLSFDIGTIHMNSYSEFATMAQVGQTFNLTFERNIVGNLDPCATGCSITGFVDARDYIPENIGGGELNNSAIRLVANLGEGNCRGGVLSGCTFRDDLFAPIARQVIVDQSDLGNNEVSGEDILAFLGQLSAPNVLATQSNNAAVIARLYAMGIDPYNPATFPPLGPGAPMPTDPILESRHYQLSFGPGVPEPSTWLLMIGGMGLAGAALRRRRVVQAA